MEFNEKLQKLRTDQGLTQEGLAEKLYVSRTAVSKWESGRGYPSIDSLKLIAKYFHVTVDELICGEEMVTLAEQDIKECNKKYGTLICGILDCFMLLLLFICHTYEIIISQSPFTVISAFSAGINTLSPFSRSSSPLS